MTVDGSSFFTTVTGNPVPVELKVTVTGGKTVSTSILVSYAVPATTVVTTTVASGS